MSLWSDYTESIFNPVNILSRENPKEEANRYLDQIPGVGRQYYNPFIEGGNKARGVLEGEYSKLLNPNSFIDELMKNYSLSKGAQYQRDELTKGLNATAAAGGFSGTPYHQTSYGNMADKIISQDMQQYLQNALGVYGKGLSGEEDFFNKGYGASSSLADLIAGNLGSQGGLAFQQANQTNASRDAFVNSLIKALSQGAGAYGG